MEIFEKIFKETPKETDYIDYKLKIDFIKNRVDFLRDVMAFSNNNYSGDQYIVYGIKERKGKLEFVGLDGSIEIEDAEYQKLVYDKIEPLINISFSLYEHDDKNFVILTISADKSQQPYMFRNKYKDIQEGDAYIRVNSSKKRMTRSNFDYIYNHRILPVEVKLRERELFIMNQDPGKLNIIIKNHSNIERLFTDVFLLIEDEDGNRLTITRMHAFKTKNEYQQGTNDSDFSLSVPKQSEITGVGEFGFTSTQAIIVGLDEFGVGETDYIFKLVFRYDDDKEYVFDFSECSIFAKGAVLWKIEKHAKKEQNKKI